MNNFQIAELITKECKQKNIKISELLQKCNINHSFISDIRHKNRAPSVDKISVIADYLNVSVDYLLGRTEEPQTMNQVNNGNIGNNSNVNINKSNLSDTDSELITEFKKLTFTDKAKVMSLIAELSQKE
mgnify:CR=1 FL=1